MRRTLEPRGLRTSAPSWRVRLLRILSVVLLLACAVVLTRLGLSAYANRRGTDALRRSDYAGAERWFAQNRTANWFEPWKAPYNTGVAQYYADNWQQSELSFAEALRLAPPSKRCLVALNLAWAHEAEGDALHARGDLAGAALAWQESATVLQQTSCAGAAPDDDPAQDPAGSKDDRTTGTPQQQQESSQQRVADKEQQAAAGQGDGADQQNGSPTSSPDQQLDAHNRAAQQQTQSHEGGDDGANGAGGEPRW